MGLLSDNRFAKNSPCFFSFYFAPRNVQKIEVYDPPLPHPKPGLIFYTISGEKKYLMATSHFAHLSTFMLTTLKVIILSRLHFWSLKFDQILAFQISQDVIYGRAKSSETNVSPLAIISTPNSFEIKNPSAKSIKSESNF